LDKVIQEMPEVTGKGVVVGSVDTGVDGTHPALANKILLFYDGATRQRGTAHDIDIHGTHTAGTIFRWRTALRILIGVAPEARFDRGRSTQWLR